MNDHSPNGGSTAAESVSELPTFLPPTDIIETKDAILMFLDIPGADPDSLDVSVDKRMLEVSARTTPFMPEGYSLVHAEYRDGNYQRRFTLSDQVDAERIEAVVKDGVLSLTLPKSAQSQPKKISVQAA